MSTSQSLSQRGVQTPERVQERVSVAPRVDVYENPDGLLVLADLPGATKDTVEINLDKGQLTIEARREGKTYATTLSSEYRPVDYYRVFAVPQGIDASKIEADLDSGVLRLRLPKAESIKPKRIEIKTR